MAYVAAGFVRQVQRQSARLEELAMHDDLTGLANRRRFEIALTQAVASGSPQVCLLDLNGFKSINDRLGHAVGDRLLIAVADRLRGGLRDADLVARMGGDEFAILLADASEEDGDLFVGRLCAALREALEVGDLELLVGASIGVADMTGTDDPVEVLRRADVAMYAAKADGGRFRRYAIDLDDDAGEEAHLGAELRTALHGGQFRLAYQPIVALPGGEVRYVESLIRWQHPTRGFVSPCDFIPVAERNGMIVELGEWILRTACTQFVRWRSTGGPAPTKISVNVSARQLAEPGFAAIQVSNGLGLSAVAEGVETAEQAAEPHRLGYQLAQGYHFGKPVAEPAFTVAAHV